MEKNRETYEHQRYLTAFDRMVRYLPRTGLVGTEKNDELIVSEVREEYSRLLPQLPRIEDKHILNDNLV